MRNLYARFVLWLIGPALAGIKNELEAEPLRIVSLQMIAPRPGHSPRADIVIRAPITASDGAVAAACQALSATALPLMDLAAETRSGRKRRISSYRAARRRTQNRDRELSL